MVCERRNQKSKSFKYSSKIVFYISNKIIALFEVWKKTKGKNPRAAKTNKGKPILLSKCTDCGSKKLRFIKE